MFRIVLLSVCVFLPGALSTDCENIMCNNGGTCESGSCLCPEGLAGPTCLLSTCNSEDDCDGTNCVMTQTKGIGIEGICDEATTPSSVSTTENTTPDIREASGGLQMTSYGLPLMLMLVGVTLL